MINSFSLVNKRNISSLINVFLLFLTTIILAYAIVYKNYYVMFLIGSLFLGLILVKSNVLPIAFILIVVSFTEWGVEYGYLPPQIMWAPELMSGLLFIKALVYRNISRQKINLFGMKVIVGFLVIVFVSILFNGSNLISALLFLRLLFRYYLLLLAILNLDFEEKQMKLINNILIFIFLAQLPLSVVKMIIYGPSERSLALSSHSVSAIIPLIAIGFLLSFYFFYRRSLVYILLSLGFVGFSIIGEKRAFFLFLGISIVYIGWFFRNDVKNLLKYILIGILLFTVSSYFIFRLIPSLNPQNKVWGKFDPGYVLNYSYHYTTQTSPQKKTIGRTSTSINIFNRLYDQGIDNFLFGFGPGIIIMSMFETFDMRELTSTKFGVGYGTNGLSWLGLQVGYLGAIVFFLLFYLILRRAHDYFKKETDSYWCSFALGMCVFTFIFLLSSLTYSPFFNHDAISSIFFCLVGFVIVRNQLGEENVSIHNSSSGE